MDSNKIYKNAGGMSATSSLKHLHPYERTLGTPAMRNNGINQQASNSRKEDTILPANIDLT
jgi:hypothetical protein